MSHTIVTVWGGTYNGFIDVDGLACAIAYAELLRHEGKHSTAILTDPFNSSVTPALSRIAKNFSSEPMEGTDYAIVDMSDPKVLETFVPLERITEIYDHHFGFESYWNERIGSASKIEYIGAAATLIWEEYRNRGFTDAISHESATLLAHAIISNTANFQSNTTSDRDKLALLELVIVAKLVDGWEISYFEEQQEYIRQNIQQSIQYDTKKCISPLLSEPYAFGQMEIWDGEELLADIDLSKVFTELGFSNWVFNFINIRSGKTTIVSNSEKILEMLSEKFSTPHDQGMIQLDRTVFRKEILVHLQ